MVDPTGAKSELRRWFQTTIQYFTWFYIVGNPVMFAFIVWVAYRYGHIKLGHKNAEPEFSDIAYFSMLFSAGVGVGLFFYGVSEPLWHQSSNYYANAGYHTQDEVDQWALEITMYHWGFAAWSPYLIMALATGLAAFCFDLPITVRSCFYPIFGEYVWAVAGICTSLGLGTMQMTTGLQRLGWIDPAEEDLSGTYVTIVCVITLFATISVVTGLKVGIKALSQLGFILGCLILFLCFIMEKSYYLLDLLVQTTGFYLQWSFFQVPFWTDAFAALEPGEGRAIDGKAGESWWIGSWTVFYMAWWVSWTCFVGIFINLEKQDHPKRGCWRVHCANCLCARLFSFMGGIGLRQSRQALELEKLGTDFYDNAAHFQSADNTFCYDVPQEDVVVDGNVIFTNTLLGITPVCMFDSANSESAWFNVMYSFTYPGSGAEGNFPGFGQFMIWSLMRSPRMEKKNITRCRESFGLSTKELSLLGCCGLEVLMPSLRFKQHQLFSVCRFFMCWTVYKMCAALDNHGQEDFHDPKVLLPKKSWTIPLYGGVFNYMEALFSAGKIHPQMKEEGIVTPPVSDIFIVLSFGLEEEEFQVQHLHDGRLCIIAFPLDCSICLRQNDLAFAWTVFFINACILISVRLEVRTKLGITGNVVGDFIACSFMYPQGLLQMKKQMSELNEGHLDKDDDVELKEIGLAEKESELAGSGLIMSA
ncbi:hypothetical protein ACHAWO_013333 [Cyclotella atomus]|uniref:Uncharacterized protein n=1 Tax=Cyclotella atomus TaxID=382360 RepID=A0ABD3PF31_9STRA